MDSSEGDASVLTDETDCWSHNSSPVRRRAQLRFSRIRGALNRSCSVPDSNNPPCLSTSPPGDISIPVSDLTEIGAEDQSVWNNRGQKLDRGKSCESYSYRNTEDCEAASLGHEGVDDRRGDATVQESTEGPSEDQSPDQTSSYTSCQAPEQEQKLSEDRVAPNRLHVSNNHMTKSMLCLTEGSQDEVSTADRTLCDRTLLNGFKIKGGHRHTDDLKCEGVVDVHVMISSYKEAHSANYIITHFTASEEQLDDYIHLSKIIKATSS